MSRSESLDARVPYAEAGRAHRDAVRRAHSLGLPLVQERVLVAVVALTASYSKLSDHVYLGEIAAIAYGVETSEPWQQEKTRKALKALADHGLIERHPPKGRPNEGTSGPRYYVGLNPRAESQPSSGPHSLPESQPSSGRKVSPVRVGKSAQSGPESQPSLGGPTEESTEKVTEESTEKVSPSSKSRSRAPSTKGQSQGQEHTTGENLKEDEGVDGQALGGRWDEYLTPEDDIEIPEKLRARWTTENAWCAFKGCPAATPDGSRFCLDHADDVDGPEESAPTSKVSDNDPPVDGSEETPSGAPQSDPAVDGEPESVVPTNGQPVNGQRPATASPSSARTRGRPGPEPPVGGVATKRRVRSWRELDDVWTCPHCGILMPEAPEDGVCGECENGTLTLKQRAAKKARTAREWGA